MSFIFNEKGFQAEIILENGTHFLSPEEREYFKDVLSKENIGFSCVESRSDSEASLFSKIVISFNQKLTSLLIEGLILPGVYDTIKLIVCKIVSGIKSGIMKIFSSKSIAIPTPILKFSTPKGSIEAPIPENLPDTQFDKYMDMLVEAIQSLTEDIIREGHLVAEPEPQSGKVRIMTVDE